MSSNICLLLHTEFIQIPKWAVKFINHYVRNVREAKIGGKIY